MLFWSLVQPTFYAHTPSYIIINSHFTLHDEYKNSQQWFRQWLIPVQHQAITNDEADLLVIGPLGTNSSDFFYKNMEVFFQNIKS